MTKQEDIREHIKQQIELAIIGVIVASEFTKDYGGLVREARKEIIKMADSQDVVIKVEGELPEELTNNIGCMSRVQIEDFAARVLRECGYPYTMKWTTAGNIMIEPFIYIDERNIGQYPYLTKYWVLHEIAHIDTHPQDDRHGELFHGKLAELINRFVAGYVAGESLIEVSH
ncbi:hypothetical protein LCGC14_2574300 [marine sediment metagenome]|uniref:Uncharacterized protein n=1 Tax=marine sediment metagenome TaxID=412755 RepID=A0A0F9D937_9ZZZZ